MVVQNGDEVPGLGGGGEEAPIEVERPRAVVNPRPIRRRDPQNEEGEKLVEDFSGTPIADLVRDHPSRLLGGGEVMIDGDLVRFERVDGPPGSREWSILDHGAKLARIIIGCPRCGKVSTLAYLDEEMADWAHYVQDTGAASPSIHCEMNGRYACFGCFAHLRSFKSEDSNAPSYYGKENFRILQWKEK